MKKSFYFLSILILFLFNSISVNAIETDFKALEVIGYNNNGNSLTMGEQFYCDISNGNCSMYLTTVANSYGGAWGIQSPIPLLENHTYSISLEMRSPNSGLTLSSKPNISIGTTMDNARNNYVNSYFNTETLTSSVHNYIIQYAFKANSNANYLIIPFTTFSTTYSVFYIDKLIIDDLGATSVSSSEINNILNNQTSILQYDINNINENINNTFNDCVQNIMPYPYTLASGNYDGLEVTINTNGSIRLYGQTNTFQFLNIGYTNIFNDNLPGAKGWCDSSGYCLTPVDGLGYTKSNNVIWFIVYTDRFYDMTIYPMITKGSVPSEFIPPGTEVCKSKLDNFNDTQKETNNKLDDLNDNLTNSDSSGASSDASNFFSNFSTDTFGLTSVITSPLELIKSVTSKTCTPLQLTLPFVNKQLNLPCLSTIYENHFGSFLTIYRTITFGFVSYWVCIKIFNLVKDFKNPEHDEIEVLDL